MNRIFLACLAGALVAAAAPGTGVRSATAQERGDTELRGPSLPRYVAREVVDLYNAPGTMRVSSTSSMRTRHSPRAWRASSQLASAATSEPKCSGPVGDGANLPLTTGARPPPADLPGASRTI